jgi:hypothetical protein
MRQVTDLVILDIQGLQSSKMDLVGAPHILFIWHH